MIDSLTIAASGMQAHQAQVNAISGNLANLNTPAYKRVQVQFSELVSALDNERAAALALSPELATTGDVRAGGVMASATQRVMTDGAPRQSDGPLDVAIVGSGFLEVMLSDGSAAYTRDGRLKRSQDGLLVTAEGLPLRQAIELPEEARDVRIGSTGLVTYRLPGTLEPVTAGQLELVDFVQPATLKALGNGLYAPTEAAGAMHSGAPGSTSLGRLMQGYVESSNVNIAQEYTNLMLAQRGYEVSARMVQASDEMLGIANNLRR